jgi:hypothetical protein
VFPLIIAHFLFWALLLIGASEMGWRSRMIYVVLWLIGYAATSWLTTGSLIFLSYVALLDIALVFHVFQGDIQLR